MPDTVTWYSILMGTSSDMKSKSKAKLTMSDPQKSQEAFDAGAAYINSILGSELDTGKWATKPISSVHNRINEEYERLIQQEARRMKALQEKLEQVNPPKPKQKEAGIPIEETKEVDTSIRKLKL